MQDATIDNKPFSSMDKTALNRMSDYEFRLMRDCIHEFCGIYYDDSKDSVLASRIAFRMKLLDIKSYSEYYNYLKYNPRTKEEMEDLIPHLTNNETYFFREMAQLNFFVSSLMDKIKERKKERGDRKIRILSCGCSSGEEAFTLAILLEEAGMYLRGWDIEIAGVDIDRKVIEKAGTGVYTSYSLRAMEKPEIVKYFDADGDKYRLKKRIRDKVVFHRGNLLEADSLSRFRHADAIFCRNVFIYFSDEATRRITDNFYETLSGAGYLMLGHSESLTRITDVFDPKRFPGIILYTKKG